MGVQLTLMSALVPNLVPATDDSFHAPTIMDLFPPVVAFAGTPFAIDRVMMIRLIMTLLLVLCLVLLAIASWWQTKLLRELRRVSPSPWRWIALLAAVVAVVLVLTWATGVQAEASEMLVSLGIWMLTAVLLVPAISVGTHALVKILAARTPDAPTR